MISVVDAQRDILLDPRGTNVWRCVHNDTSLVTIDVLTVATTSSGQEVQSLNSAAVTWSLAKQLYGPHGPYIWIPLGLVFGMIPTTIQWAIARVRQLDLSVFNGSAHNRLYLRRNGP